MTTEQNQSKWWRRIRLFLLGVVILAVGIAIGWGVFYASVNARSLPDWTGLPGDAVPAGATPAPVVIYDQPRDLWDWLQLLLVPLVIAVGGATLTISENRTAQRLQDQRDKAARELEEQRALDVRLQEYLTAMTELLLEKNLRKSKPEDEVRSVARARTLTVLGRLDGTRKVAVVKFLHEAKLLGETNTIALGGADLRGVNLNWDALPGANLAGANLAGANLATANLAGTNLEGANLDRANLEGANLEGASLREAILRDANMQGAFLKQANLRRAFLEGANLQGAYLYGTVLREADLHKVVLRGAQLVDADLLQSSLGDADLREANLAKSHVAIQQLAGARFIKGAILPDGITHADVEAYRKQMSASVEQHSPPEQN